MYNEIAMKYRGISYDGLTKQDKKRVQIALEWMEREYHGQGLNGCIRELFNCLPTSNKYEVSTSGKIDNSLKFSINGKIRYIPAESKTNGGRIEALYEKGAPKFVIYSMDLTLNHKAGKRTDAWTEVRTIQGKVIPTAVFLANLEAMGAIKMTNGKQNERAIQVSSKKLFQWLESWTVDFIPGMTYTEDMF